jgi:O-antigen ligase
MNANGVGRIGAVGILMLIISAAEYGRRRLLHPVNLVLFLGLGVGLMLTQSRGSMLGVLGAALAIAWGQPRVQHRMLALGACVMLFGGLVMAAVLVDPAAMQGRWQSTTEKDDLAGKTAGRSEIARTAGLMIRDNWIAGVGAGQFDVVYPEYSVLAHSAYNNSTEAQSHSAYLKVSTEGGIVGTVLLLCFYGALWLAASRLPPGQRRALARGIIIYLLIGSLSSEGIEKSNWLAVGLLFVWFWESRGQGLRPGTRAAGGGVRAFRRKSRTKTGSSLPAPDPNARMPEHLNAPSGAT